MKPLLKKYYFFAICLFMGLVVSAQGKTYNSFSAEISSGIHIPIAPGDRISRSKYIALKHFQGSIRYMFNEKWGIKGHYAYDRFQNPRFKQNGITLNRIDLEAVGNVGELLKVDYHARYSATLLIHTGMGLTLAKPSSQNSNEKMVNFIFGITPLAKLTDRWALLGDLSLIGNFGQHYAYNGKPLKNLGSKTGTFIDLSIGIIYYIGNKPYHADWH